MGNMFLSLQKPLNVTKVIYELQLCEKKLSGWLSYKYVLINIISSNRGQRSSIGRQLLGTWAVILNTHWISKIYNLNLTNDFLKY